MPIEFKSGFHRSGPSLIRCGGAAHIPSGDMTRLAASVERFVRSDVLPQVKDIIVQKKLSGVTGVSKTGEPVTQNSVRSEADVEISKAIIPTLRKIYADHYVISEEAGYMPKPDADLTGCFHTVDEVDGTKAFVETVFDPNAAFRGQYGFAYGLFFDGYPLYSTFYMPDFFNIKGHEGLSGHFPSELGGAVFSASIAREDAYLNDRKIQIDNSYDPKADENIIHSEDINHGDGYREWNYDPIRGYSGNLREEIRSATYEFCMTAASGTKDAAGNRIFPNAPKFMLRPVPCAWDALIGGFIVEKAGGLFVYPDGSSIWPVVVNPARDSLREWRMPSNICANNKALSRYMDEINKDRFKNVAAGLRLGNDVRSFGNMIEEILPTLTQKDAGELTDAAKEGLEKIRANVSSTTEKRRFRTGYEAGYQYVIDALKTIRS